MTNIIPILTKPQTKIDESPEEQLINQLPPEMLALIFQNLSETALLEVRTVCHLWNALIENKISTILKIKKILKESIPLKEKIDQAFFFVEQKRTSKKYLKILNVAVDLLINIIHLNLSLPLLRETTESITSVRFWFLISEKFWFVHSTDLIPAKMKPLVQHFKDIRYYEQALYKVPKNERTAEICLEAVKQNPWALYKVPKNERTAEICLEAVKQDGKTLKYVPENKRTKKLCRIAVKQDWRALQYVPKHMRTEEIYRIAANQNSWAFKCVPKNQRTLEFYRIAVAQNWRTLKDVLHEEGKKKLTILLLFIFFKAFTNFFRSLFMNILIKSPST